MQACSMEKVPAVSTRGDTHASTTCLPSRVTGTKSPEITRGAPLADTRRQITRRCPIVCTWLAARTRKIMRSRERGKKWEKKQKTDKKTLFRRREFLFLYRKTRECRKKNETQHAMMLMIMAQKALN